MPPLDEQSRPNYVISLGQLCRWLSRSQQKPSALKFSRVLPPSTSN